MSPSYLIGLLPLQPYFNIHALVKNKTISGLDKKSKNIFAEESSPRDFAKSLFVCLLACALVSFDYFVSLMILLFGYGLFVHFFVYVCFIALLCVFFFQAPADTVA